MDVAISLEAKLSTENMTSEEEKGGTELSQSHQCRHRNTSFQWYISPTHLLNLHKTIRIATLDQPYLIQHSISQSAHPDHVA